MASPQIDAGASARTRIAARLLPFLFLLYVANYLDRTNIAYATLGMKGDLGLTDSVFGTASGIFFIGYFALQIPGALLVERWSAQASAGDHPDHLGRAHDSDRFCAHSAGALRRAISIRRGGGRVLSRRHRLSFPLVYLSGPGQGGGAVHVRDSHCLHRRRPTRRLHPGGSLARPSWMALAFFAGRRARDCSWESRRCSGCRTGPAKRDGCAPEERDWMTARLARRATR